MPFLSLLDDRAKPKGSRDPLGFELVWTHYGRQVIGNLTTITSSLDNFAVALLGFHWANEIHGAGPKSERQSNVCETFLRFEQLAGYLRYLSGMSDIMGVTRVSKRMDDPSTKISFGLSADQQILSDQTNYGLWGFYSNPLRDTGLVASEERDLTPQGRLLAERIERHLDKEALIDLILSKRRVSHDVLVGWSRPFVRAIKKKQTQEELLTLLMQGGTDVRDTDGKSLQREVWRLTRQFAQSGALPDNTPDFIKSLRASTTNEGLKHRLLEIESVERLLVAANNIFHYCRRKDGESVRTIVNALRDLSYNHISEDLDLTPASSRGAQLGLIRSALLAGDMASALREVLTLNRQVMENRDGAPWVEIERNTTLRVRKPSETATLRGQQELESDWDYEYFMSSYLSIARRALLA